MIIACPACSKRFKVDATRLSAKGTKVRCAGCGHVWLQRPEDLPEPEELVLEPEPLPPPPREPEPEPEPESDEPAPLPRPAPRGEEIREVPIPVFARGESHYGTQAEASRGGIGRLALRAGWALLLLIVVIGLGGGYLFRLDIVRAWPRTAAVYDLLGLEVNVVGIDFRNVSAGRTVSDGALAVELQGEIVNTSSHRVAVPELYAAIRDEAGRELAHWTFQAFADSLGPKEVSAFASSHGPVPAGAKDVKLRFAAK